MVPRPFVRRPGLARLSSHPFGNRWIKVLALSGLCAAYLQGSWNKATDFPSAIAEMQHFGLSPAVPLAMLTMAFELVASLMVITGFCRWAGALGLAAFTLFATFVANRYWELLPPERFMAANSFYEHFGLVGGFLFVAWQDLQDETAGTDVDRSRLGAPDRHQR